MIIVFIWAPKIMPKRFGGNLTLGPGMVFGKKIFLVHPPIHGNPGKTGFYSSLY